MKRSFYVVVLILEYDIISLSKGNLAPMQEYLKLPPS